MNFYQLRLFVFIVIISIIFWGTMTIIADMLNAQWPQLYYEKVGLGLIALIIEFLAIKLYLMTTRSENLTRLGLSLIGTNFSFLVSYIVALILVLWPQLTDNLLIKYGLIAQVFVFFSWGTYQLAINSKNYGYHPSVAVIGWCLIIAIIVVTAVIMRFYGIELPPFPQYSLKDIL